MSDEVDIKEIKSDVKKAVQKLTDQAGLEQDDIFILGLSTSEVAGYKIGKASSIEVGTAIVETIRAVLSSKNIHLAVQGCEHINRSLVVEKDLAKKLNLEIVNVKPALHAGGAGTVAAYEQSENPVVVEFITANAGIDIGDTSIGMHVKHVQVPVRLEVKEIGQAHVTALRSRPKNIGGTRAEYPI